MLTKSDLDAADLVVMERMIRIIRGELTIAEGGEAAPKDLAVLFRAYVLRNNALGMGLPGLMVAMNYAFMLGRATAVGSTRGDQ